MIAQDRTRLTGRLQFFRAAPAALPWLAAAGLALAGCASAPRWPAPADGLTATAPARGYVLVDRGTMVLGGGAMARRESFDTWHGPAGERWQRSVVTAADGSYRVEGEWRSDARDTRHQVRGKGAIAGEALEVSFDVQPGRAHLEIRRGARPLEVLEGVCTPACFVDLAPSATATFAMARTPGLRRGEVREFRWVGHALQADSVLLDGVARYVRLGEIDVPRPDGSRLRVRHDAFEETVTDLRSGRSGKAFFNLWTDLEGRPLKFAAARTVGLRVGFEDLGNLPPATLEQVFPPAAGR